MSMINSENSRSSEANGVDPLSGYSTSPGAYDEMLSADGLVRQQWRPLLDGIGGLSEADRKLAFRNAQRMLHQNGMTYVARDDPNRRSRPWQLDLLPMLIQPSEWQALEAGLIQRAELLNVILKDLYGPQTLVNQGVLPAALVFGNPQFLRPCHGIEAPGDTYLHFMAFDLARAEDGRWWVLSDRTQTPSGAGYALENRIIASRCLPDLFANSNVQRLASFFRAFSEGLLQHSRRDAPLAVMLSPGPTKATYFEHAYLARYLGYPIVEGSDLTVRDDRLFLKTVEGLKPVDLVLRRVDSELCDPLELRPDSVMGVPGLLHVARAGQVVIANALGSGLLENEALRSFLPGLSRHVLGEELLLPSIATWWCGQDRERAYVRENISKLVIRKVFSPKNILEPGNDSYVGAELSAAETEQLSSLIERRGYEFIGQDMVSLSTAPQWNDDGHLTPAPMVLRLYVAATPDGYRVMPGGLTRMSEMGSQVPWLSPGNRSKDTWVLWDGPIDTFSLLGQSSANLNLRRGGRNLPSRSADNLYWLGRYTERTEGAVRLLRSLVARLSGETGPWEAPVTLDLLGSLLVVQGHASTRRVRQAIEGGSRAVENELWTILFDPDSDDGLAHVLANVRRTAERVRERLSLDTWQIIQDLNELPQGWNLRSGRELDDADQLLDRMVQDLSAFNGMVMENMTRGFGWRFIDLGRRLERVRHASKMIRHLTAREDVESTGALSLLLELADSAMTYRTRYMSNPQLPQALDLLLADDTNPRSVLFQIAACREHLAALPSDTADSVMSPAQKLATRLDTELRLADVVMLATPNARNGNRSALDRLMKRVDSGIDELSDLVARTYFSHSMPQQVSGPVWSERVT